MHDWDIDHFDQQGDDTVGTVGTKSPVRREDWGKKIDYPIPILSLESFNLLRIYVLEIIHTLMELVLNVHSKLPTMLEMSS